MRRNENQKYTLENKLRTWSQLKAEQDALLAANPGGVAPPGMSRRGSYQRRLSMDRRKSFTNDNANITTTNNAGTLTLHPLSQTTSATESTDNHHHHHHHRTVDAEDKNSIEKAVNDNSDKQSTKAPAVKVSTPEGKDTKDLITNGTQDRNQGTCNNVDLDDEEEDFSHLDRGRDGGGSKSGFNSSDEEEENVGIDSDHENQLEACIIGHIEKVRAERLGDIKQESDSENDAGPGALTPVLEMLKMED